jgi:hypothetical protein
MPWTAESTLVSGSDMLMVWLNEAGLDQVIGESLQTKEPSEQPARWQETEAKSGIGCYLPTFGDLEWLGWRRLTLTA